MSTQESSEVSPVVQAICEGAGTAGAIVIWFSYLKAGVLMVQSIVAGETAEAVFWFGVTLTVLGVTVYLLKLGQSDHPEDE